MGSVGCELLGVGLETTTAPAVELTTGAVESVPVVALLDSVVTSLFDADVVRTKRCFAELFIDALVTAAVDVTLVGVVSELVREAAEAALAVTWLLFFLPELLPS